MTQFKEKADQLGNHAGILTYPILMAADILIHKANEVPVGDDQTQHLELTRNIVERSNNTYGEIFPLPERKTGKVFYGKIPKYSVVVPGSFNDKKSKVNLYCAVIVKRVDEKTRSKTSINELLRN